MVLVQICGRVARRSRGWRVSKSSGLAVVCQWFVSFPCLVIVVLLCDVTKQKVTLTNRDYKRCTAM